MAHSILVVDDDQSLADMVVEYLAQNGLEAEHAADATTGLGRLEERDYDALILDVMLPGLDGFETVRQLRRTSDIPILMLTARGDATDRVVGLELGADDYLTKPFHPRELLARIRALIRRSEGRASPGDGVLKLGELEIDRTRRRVRVEGTERALTGYQFDLLLLLADNAGRVMSRERLFNHLRGIGHEAYDRSIDVHVSRIRAAIEDDPKNPRRVLTVRGSGYVLAPDEES